jgi:hypothetical protein
MGFRHKVAGISGYATPHGGLRLVQQNNPDGLPAQPGPAAQYALRCGILHNSARVADVANRRVVQIEPSRGDQGQASARIFDYLDRKQIILLGDPGAGKTHCFRRMAAAEQAPIYSVQRFVALNGDDKARTVYLDGLDEYRPRTSARDSNAAITLLQILRKSGRPRLRLSCRFADWLGNTDLELFKDYCGDADYAVLSLEPLNQPEALEILADQGITQPETFLAEATAKHMEWTVSAPQTLRMLADVVSHSGWPSTKRDLYEQWTQRHLAEHKESLHNSQLGSYTAADPPSVVRQKSCNVVAGGG